MDRRLFFMLNRARAVLYRYADKGVEEAIGVPAAQVSLLFALDKLPQASMQQLGEALGLNNSAMTGLVQRMKTNKLIERVVSQEDARVAHLRMTSKGRDKMNAAKPLLSSLNKQLIEGFSTDEINTVLKFLNTVHARFSQTTGDTE
ncbi:MAG: MarR family winged helix-turn-helix transcriptional regulator [Burkholderiales bacterium]|jgi:DNA-binding MarR family transcriptional regulator|uniref:MarR family winged helix-turn-helix transcriptional regulator n=1 Tax=Limnobacter sp. TaxID=2003368 RepID=UPI0039471D04|nr:MarR family winged helix-turn-helix transcriptional regulator [Burkholderiales bacterium]